MYNRSQNSQVIYSLDSLSNALFNLLTNNKLEDITIIRLCAESDVNRRTFYRNCENIMDLIYYKIDKLVNNLLKLIDSSINDDKKHFAVFFNYWYAHKSFLKILSKEKLILHFVERFKALYFKTSNHFIEHISTKMEHIKNLKLYYNSFIIGALSNLLVCWVENDFNEPIKHLIEISYSLIPIHE